MSLKHRSISIGHPGSGCSPRGSDCVGGMRTPLPVINGRTKSAWTCLVADNVSGI